MKKQNNEKNEKNLKAMKFIPTIISKSQQVKVKGGMANSADGIIEDQDGVINIEVP